MYAGVPPTGNQPGKNNKAEDGAGKRTTSNSRACSGAGMGIREGIAPKTLLSLLPVDTDQSHRGASQLSKPEGSSGGDAFILLAPQFRFGAWVSHGEILAS